MLSQIVTIKGKTCETRSYCNKPYRRNDYYDNDFLQMARFETRIFQANSRIPYSI